MTKKYSTKELCDAWAEDPKGFTGRSNGACWCGGGVFYSYNEPIAEVIPGTTSVLFSTRKWSVTTSKHQSWLRGGLLRFGWALEETDQRINNELPVPQVH